MNVTNVARKLFTPRNALAASTILASVAFTTAASAQTQSANSSSALHYILPVNDVTPPKGNKFTTDVTLFKAAGQLQDGTLILRGPANGLYANVDGRISPLMSSTGGTLIIAKKDGTYWEVQKNMSLNQVYFSGYGDNAGNYLFLSKNAEAVGGANGMPIANLMAMLAKNGDTAPFKHGVWTVAYAQNSFIKTIWPTNAPSS